MREISEFANDEHPNYKTQYGSQYADFIPTSVAKQLINPLVVNKSTQFHIDIENVARFILSPINHGGLIGGHWALAVRTLLSKT